MKKALKDFFKNNKRSKGLTNTALQVVTAIVALFIGLYMISKVSDVASIDNTSDFYTTYTSLTTDTGTIFDVVILVIIVFTLGLAINVLRGFTGGGGRGATL